MPRHPRRPYRHVQPHVLVHEVAPAWKRAKDVDVERAAVEAAFQASELGVEDHLVAVVGALKVVAAVLRIVEQEELYIDP